MASKYDMISCMDTTERNMGRTCPKCGGASHQMNSGFTRAGSQRCLCWHCKCKYTPQPKEWAIPEWRRKEALKMMTLGNSGRKVGAYYKMHHTNVYRWAVEGAKKGASKST